MAAVNIGAAGAITVDGERFEMKNKECLYIPMGSKDVSFEGDGARFYLASLPAHKVCPIRHITLDQAKPARARRPCQFEPADDLPARDPRRVRKRAARCSG